MLPPQMHACQPEQMASARPCGCCDAHGILRRRRTCRGIPHTFCRTATRLWPSSPANSAAERDFHVVELGPGDDPDMMEKILSQLEGEFSRVVRHIVVQKRLP